MSAKDVLKMMKENEVKWVDLRFTDTRGKEQHVSLPISEINEDFFEEGKMFDGSSIAGWKGINESDMILMPEPATAVLDPFAVPLEKKTGLLMDAMEAMHKVPGVRRSRGTLWAQRDIKLFASTEGSRIRFNLLAVNGSVGATAVHDGRFASRTFLNPVPAHRLRARRAVRPTRGRNEPAVR